MKVPKSPEAETEAAPAAHDPDTAPIVAVDADGRERPLSGGSFVRVDGKLQRREA